MIDLTDRVDFHASVFVTSKPTVPAVLVLTFMRHVGGGLLDLTNERAGADSY